MSSEGDGQRTVIERLQAPGAVVTYRAFVGIMATAIVALLAIIGNNLQDGQKSLERAMNNVRATLANNTAQISALGERTGRAEHDIDNLSDKADLLDHRVTIIETREGH